MIHSRRWLAPAALLLVMAPQLAYAGEWACFRGAPGNPGVAAERLPARLRLAWRVRTGGQIESTAAISGGMAYVPTKQGRVLAIRLADHRTLWSFRGVDAFSSSPLVWRGTVFLGDEGGVFYALDAKTGHLRWKRQTQDKIVSSAAAAGSAIVFGSYDTHVYSLDAQTGRVRWKHSTPAQVNCAPCVVASRVIVAGCDGSVHFLDEKTGRQLNEIRIGGNFGASAASDGKRAYVGSLVGVYLAAAVPSGKLAWKVAENEPGAACYASAAVGGGAVIFASRSKRVFRVNPANGKAKWTFHTRGEVNSSPVICGRTVFVGSGEGALYGIEVATGKKVWEFRTGGEIKASPAIGEGRLVIGSTDGYLYCFQP